jgi:hypothetical protein
MAYATSSPQLAPKYVLHRQDIGAPDAASITNSKKGMNMSCYEYAHIQVVPKAGVNPDVAVLWWSDAAGKFVREHTAIAKSGVGAGVAYEFTVEPRGRIMFVAITAVITDTVSVYVSGFNVVHPS